MEVHEKHWYVIASRDEVKVFEKGATNNIRTSYGLKLVKLIKNPLAKLRNRDMIKKQAGTVTKSIGRQGTVRHIEAKRISPVEQSAVQFAKIISNYLVSEGYKKKYSNLTILAEPHFLGKLRSEMSKKTKDVVTDWIKKDIHKLSIPQVESYFAKLSP